MREGFVLVIPTNSRNVLTYLFFRRRLIKCLLHALIVTLLSSSTFRQQLTPLVSLGSTTPERIALRPPPLPWCRVAVVPQEWGQAVSGYRGLGLVKRRTDFFSTSAPSVCPVVAAIVCRTVTSYSSSSLNARARMPFKRSSSITSSFYYAPVEIIYFRYRRFYFIFTRIL